MYLKADTKIFFFLNSLGEALEDLLAAAKERFFDRRGQRVYSRLSVLIPIQRVKYARFFKLTTGV